MWRWGAGALAAAIFAVQGHAAEFKIDKRDGKTRLLLTGRIMPGDAGKFAAAIKAAKSRGDAVTIVVLNSPGGDGHDSIKIAKAVREAKMTTSVPASAVCTSGCFIVFAGGTERMAEPSSLIGVHAAAHTDGRETGASRRHTLEVTRMLRSLGVSASITDKLIRTPHKDLAMVSEDELRSGMNVTIGGVGAAAAKFAATGEFAALIEAQVIAARHDPSASMKAWDSCLRQNAVGVARDSNATPQEVAEALYGQCKSEEARAYEEAVDAAPTNRDAATARRWKDEVDNQLWPAVRRVRAEKAVAAIRDDRVKTRVYTGKTDSSLPFQLPPQWPVQSTPPPAGWAPAPWPERKTTKAGTQ